jgi:hypothetical protein
MFISSYVFSKVRKRTGNIFGRFFGTNSSGHPVRCRPFQERASVDDLISLGSAGAADDDIFDPLLRKPAERGGTFQCSLTKPQLGPLPRPPSAKVSAITQMYEQNQHKPLQRPDSTNPFRLKSYLNLNIEIRSDNTRELQLLSSDRFCVVQPNFDVSYE